MRARSNNLTCEGCVLGDDAVKENKLSPLREECAGSEQLETIRNEDGTIQAVVASCPKFLGAVHAVVGFVTNNPPLREIVDRTQMEIGEKWLAKMRD